MCCLTVPELVRLIGGAPLGNRYNPILEAETMTYHELREKYDFSPTKPDLCERVARAVHGGLQTIITCTGRPSRVITWSDNGYEAPFDAGNFAFRIDENDARSLGESVIAVRVLRFPNWCAPP